MWIYFGPFANIEIRHGPRPSREFIDLASRNIWESGADVTTEAVYARWEKARARCLELEQDLR